MHSIKDTVKQLIGKSLDAYNKKYTSPINTRIDNIVAQAGNDNTEIVDARIDSAGVTHTTLNNRILAETKMTDEKLMEYTGSSLSIEDTMPGYLQNIEIKGNTIQNEDNLEDIRSVGDKVEGQELYEIPVLSRGKNLFDANEFTPNLGVYEYSYTNGILTMRCDGIKHRRVDYTLPNTLIHGKRYTLTANLKILECSSGFAPGINCGYGFYQDSNNTYYGEFNSSNNTMRLDFIYDEQGYNVIGFHNESQDGVTKIQWSNIQLEEGIVATSYEPYVEDKLTILSPVQLEKVGDVRDRIIEKNGVWGVEKNTIRKSLTASSVAHNGTVNGLTEYIIDTLENSDTTITSNVICNKLVNKFSTTEEGCFVTKNQFRVRVLTNTYPNTESIKNEVINNKWYIIYKSAQPQFIPLPHNQQIKLRTFANKTNISFLTEIEGTIKAQVPKSLGATVNTHTEQISNLNKELDRVKKLEESTVSTVETESDFTTVEATSNGYFEDVKLEGKTLVNLFNYKSLDIINEVNIYVSARNYELTKGKEVTLVNNTDKVIIYDVSKDSSWFRSYILNANTCIKATLEESEYIKCCYGAGARGWDVNSESDKEKIKKTCIILEGDHTQNPPSYFEGLKSVGQSATTSEDGADEIVVSSVNENLFDGKIQTAYINNNTFASANSSKSIVFRCEQNTDYIFSAKEEFDRSVVGGSNSEIAIGTPLSQINATKKGNSIYFNSGQFNYIAIYFNTIDSIFTEVRVIKGTTPKPCIPHISDKKRLLYYNNETQAWEKPILRQWDSIEKHANGKYYYHQRSGEVVLNGSEDWGLPTLETGQVDTNWETETHIAFRTTDLINPKEVFWGSQQTCICNRFKVGILNDTTYTLSDEFIGQNTLWLDIKISKSKLSTQDAQGFKQWLQANNVTVVYQLAQEKVYECTNIDLITYANETNYVIESGAIAPRTILKVHNNISNVVSLLQKKVSLLESDITRYMITQNRLQLSSTYSSDSVTFKVDYTVCSENMSQENYDTDLYNLILNNILVGKDNYNYDHMFNIIMDYASWSQISWDQFDILVGIMDLQHNPPIEEIPTDDEIVEEIPNEII